MKRTLTFMYQGKTDCDKGYFDDESSSNETKGRHIEPDGDVSMCGWQNVEKERLVKALKQVIQTSKQSFHYSEITSMKYSYLVYSETKYMY